MRILFTICFCLFLFSSFASSQITINLEYDSTRVVSVHFNSPAGDLKLSPADNITNPQVKNRIVGLPCMLENKASLDLLFDSAHSWSLWPILNVLFTDTHLVKLAVDNKLELMLFDPALDNDGNVKYERLSINGQRFQDQNPENNKCWTSLRTLAEVLVQLHSILKN